MGSAALGRNPTQIQVPEFLIGKHSVTNYQFGFYRDSMGETPYALFGTNTKTKMMDVIQRYAESQVTERKKGGRTIYEVPELGEIGSKGGYKDLEVRRVVPKSGEWEMEKNAELRERFGRRGDLRWIF